MFAPREQQLLESILECFYRVTQLWTVVTDKNGKILVTPQSRLRNAGNTCLKNIKPGAVDHLRHQWWDAITSRQEFIQNGKLCTFRDYGSLAGWAWPVVIGGCHVASVVCPQLLRSGSGELLGSESLISRAFNLSKVSVQASSGFVAGRMEAAMEMLCTIVNYAAERSLEALTRQCQIDEEQTACLQKKWSPNLLEQAVERVKDNEGPEIYSLRKEQELVIKIRQKDTNGAKNLLDEVLADIFNRYSTNLTEIKARILELLVVLSRAAIEGGCQLKEILSLNSRYVEELQSLDTSDKIYRWASKVLKQFATTIAVPQDPAHRQIIRRALDYISAHFRERISVRQVAQAAYVSPGYLSKLFRKEFNCTVIEFLNRVRIEEAKRLLSDPGYSISQVAAQVGFDDLSYFSKVFRKFTGLSPKEFRQKVG